MNNLTSKKRRMQYILRSIAKPPLDYGSITTNIFTKKNPKPSYVMSGKQHNTVLENKVKNLIDLLQPKEKLKTLEKHWKKQKRFHAPPTLSLDEQGKVLSRQHLQSSFSNHNTK